MRLAPVVAGRNTNIAVVTLSCCVNSIASQCLTPGVSDRWKTWRNIIAEHSRDDGIDEERRGAAVQQVESWRRDGRLPFPRFTDETIDQLAATLDYPPRGSPHARSAPEVEKYETAEPLSKDDESEDKDKEEPVKSDRK